MLDYHKEYSDLLGRYNETLMDCNHLIDQNRDMMTLIFDMSAYITKMGVLNEDAGMATTNSMFLDRFREIIGVRRTEGIDMSKTIAGDV